MWTGQQRRTEDENRSERRSIAQQLSWLLDDLSVIIDDNKQSIQLGLYALGLIEVEVEEQQ